MDVTGGVFWFSIFLALCGLVPVVLSFFCMKDKQLAIRKRVSEIVALSIIVPALVFMLGTKLIESDVAVAIIGTIAGYFFGHSLQPKNSEPEQSSSK